MIQDQSNISSVLEKNEASIIADENMSADRNGEGESSSLIYDHSIDKTNETFIQPVV